MEVSLSFTGKPEVLAGAIERVEKKLDSLERAAVKAEKRLESIDFDQSKTMIAQTDRLEKAIQALTRAVERLSGAKRAVPSNASENVREATTTRALAHEVDNLADQYQQLTVAKGAALFGGGTALRGPGGRFVSNRGMIQRTLGSYDLGQPIIGEPEQIRSILKSTITPEHRRAFWSAFLGGMVGGGRGGGGLFDTRSGFGIDPIGGFLAMGPGGRKATGEVLATAVVGVGALLAPMAPALGILGAIPQAAATAVGALKVVGLAFENVSEAIGGSKKAYEELTPEQKKFVDMVRKDLYPLLNGMRDLAAQNLMPGVTAGLGAFLDSDNWDKVGGAIQNIAQALGNAAKSWGEFSARGDIGDRLGRIFAYSAEQIGIWSDTLQVGAENLLILMEGLRPLSEWLDRVVFKGTQWANAQLKQAEANGELDRANRVVIESLRLVGGFALSVADLFEALYEVLAPLGRDLVPYLSDRLRELADWLRANADEIRGPFIGGAEALEVVLSLLWDVVQKLYGALKALLGAFEDITGVTITWKDAILGLMALKLITTLTTWGVSIWALVAAEDAATAASNRLRRSLLLLTGIGAVVVAIELLINPPKWAERYSGKEGWGNLGRDIGNWIKDGYSRGIRTLDIFSGVQIEDQARAEGEKAGAAFGGSFGAAILGAVNNAAAQVSQVIQNAVFGPLAALGVPAAGGITDGSTPGNLLALANVAAGNAPAASAVSTPAGHVSGGRGGNWQSLQAYDVAVVTGHDVICPVDGNVIKVSSGSLEPERQSSGAITYGDSVTIRYAGGTLFFTHLLPGSTSHLRVGAFIKAGTAIGKGYKGHVHVGGTTGGGAAPTVPIPKTTIKPTGTAPPFTGSTATGPTELAPLALRIELAEAELTKRLDDDLEAINKIIKAVRKGLAGLTGEERLAGLQELKGYLDARDALIKELGEDLVGVKTVEGLRKAMSKWRSKFSEEFLKNHPGLAKLIENRMDEIDKLLSGKVKPDELKRAIEKFRNLKQGVEQVMDQIVEAVKRRADAIRDAFGPIWDVIADMAMTKFRTKVQEQLDAFDRMVEAWFAEFDARVNAYRTPAELAIEAIESAAELEGLQRNLEDAMKRLEEAKQGRTEDFESQVLSAREILGRYELARKIEKAQLSTMGGGMPTDMTDQLLRDLRMALTPVFTTNLEDIEAATRAVEDAQRQLNLYFLRGQAKKEREEFDKTMAAERKAQEEKFAEDRKNLEIQLQKEEQVYQASLAIIQAKLLAALIVGDEKAVNQILGDFKRLTGFNASEMSIVRSGIMSIADIAGSQLDTLRQIRDLLARQAGIDPSTFGTVDDTGADAGPPQGRRGPRGGSGNWKPMARGGVIRGPFIAGEAGREAVIPLSDPRFNVGGVIVIPGRGGMTGSSAGGQSNVTVVFEGDSALLEQFVKVKAVEVSDSIGRAQGARADERRRGGRF